MDADLTSDLGADELDMMELMMALEEEFDIEITEDFTEINWSFSSSYQRPQLKPISVKEIVDIICKKIQ